MFKMAVNTPWVTLVRDCEALLIPSGMPFMIPAGTGVEITQAKGGAVTIHINGQLARIDVKDIDAFGEDYAHLASRLATGAITTEADGPVDVEQIWEQLKTCYDPEIPINIVELGLIYDCHVQPSEDLKKNHVYITMTLTAPGCGMGPVIVQDVENAVRRVKNVTDVSVEMVFDPVWSRDMISDAAKLELGLF
jgi:probable FeS assembly SUF system protein SufT